MITSAALVLLLLEARSLPAVLAIVVVYSFFAELHRPASGALIADLIPSEHRVAAYAFNRLLFNLSFAIGLAIGGLLAEQHFRELFIADAATSVVFGVLSLVALPHGTRTTKEQDREVGSARAAMLRRQGVLARPRGDPRGRARLRAGVLHVPAVGPRPRVPGSRLRFPPGLERDPGCDLRARRDGDRDAASTDPDDRPRGPADGPGVRAFGILLTGIGMAGAVLVWSFGEMFGSPSTAAFIADRAPAHLRGRYQSSLGLTYSLAFTIGPIGGTALYSWWHRGLWIACAALGVIGAALALAAQRYPAPTVAEPPPG